MSFYEQFVPFEKITNNQAYAHCPMHHDTNASFTVNLDTDEWYCHGCGVGGKYIEFIEKFYGVGRDVATRAIKQWTSRKTLPFPTEKYVEECIARLQSRPAEIDVLLKFGFTEEVIHKFRLGWDDTRITIPIYSPTGKLINVRKYLPPHRRIEGSNNAKVIGVTGCNEARFYPYDNLIVAKETVWIVEGEKDCLAAISQGFNAVTGTGGSNIPIGEEEYFRNKTVYLMGDNDSTGERVQAQYMRMLDGVAKDIKVVKLPRKDFVEYWEAFHTADVKEFIQELPATPKEVETSAEATTLSKSEYVERLNSWMRLENMSVVGVDPKTYTVPFKLKVKCNNRKCEKPCKIGLSRTDITIDIDPRQILQFVDSSDQVQDAYLRKMFECKSIYSEPAAYANVQKIIFQESASFVEGLEEASFEPRYGIYLYEENRLTATVKYNFDACRVTDPRNQQNYYVIKTAEAIQQCNTKYSPECLAYFKEMSENVTSFKELIEAHYKKWEMLLGIEGRADLFGAILLSYLSVTEIPWKGGLIKGWLDTMVIGDTRTGKSQMAQRFVKHLQLGSYINGENARRTGVIGGVQRYGDSWIITWGAIPMNDRGLLIIDEASGLEVEDIKELSATRSSGAVTINKIAKGEARARTRLIWLSNPRSGRNIEDFYWKGYGAFTEFIPIVEDQARYDLVLTAAREDLTTLQGLRSGIVDVQKYRELAGFAWTIDLSNIAISKEVQECVEVTVKKLSDEYEGGPLIVGVAAHEKLLRITCAVAILCGDIIKERLVLQPKHVEYAYEFLRSTYTKSSMDYKGYVEENRKALRAKEDNTLYIRGLVATYPAIRVLLSANRFKGSQIQEILGIERSEASKILSELLQRGLMRIAYNGSYQSDKLLVDIARQMGM